METRTGMKTSGQISKMGVISGLVNADYSLNGGDAFLIKNDGITYITLDVLPAMSDTVITTMIAPGWNSELVRKIKANVALTSYNLKWGI